MRTHAKGDRGFTLAEVLVALVCLSILAAGAANLSAVALRSVRTARDETSAVALALRRLAELQSDPIDVTWIGGAPDALDRDVTGFVEYFDALGNFLGTGAAPPAEAVFVCRWRVDAGASDPAHLLVFRVRATTAIADRAAAAAGVSGGHDGSDVEVLGVRRQEAP